MPDIALLIAIFIAVFMIHRIQLFLQLSGALDISIIFTVVNIISENRYKQQTEARKIQLINRYLPPQTPNSAPPVF